jgi:hypothetical protein
MKYKKTELGKQTFKEHNASLSSRQRSAFIMFDGEKDDTLVFKMLASTGLNADDINHLLEVGLIEEAGGTSASDAGAKAAINGSAAVSEAPSAMPEQERYQRAYPVAIKLTSGLGLRGFRLNMSVESASSYKDLLAVAPKIRDAVGEEKFAELARALKGL